MLNASATVSEKEYRRRYNDLTDCFRAEEEKLKRLTAERKKRDAESVAIGGMLFELTELEAPPIEFDEKLWHAVVDHVTVYNNDRLVYSLKDGTEITIELWKIKEKSPNSTWVWCCSGIYLLYVKYVDFFFFQ